MRAKHIDTRTELKYTINADGTLEPWYLEKDCGETVYLRKTKLPKWNCAMKEFKSAEVYPSYRAAVQGLKERTE